MTSNVAKMAFHHLQIVETTANLYFQDRKKVFYDQKINT
jgi:hypothetical protein